MRSLTPLAFALRLARVPQVRSELGMRAKLTPGHHLGDEPYLERAMAKWTHQEAKLMQLLSARSSSPRRASASGMGGAAYSPRSIGAAAASGGLVSRLRVDPSERAALRYSPCETGERRLCARRGSEAPRRIWLVSV